MTDAHNLTDTASAVRIVVPSTLLPAKAAQAAMRHSDIDLTIGTYTDPKFFGVRQAVERLPAFAPHRAARRLPRVPTKVLGLVTRRDIFWHSLTRWEQ